MDSEFYSWLEKMVIYTCTIAMNVAPGISAVAELEVSELHPPALGPS